MRLRGKLRCVGTTDTGLVREHNEDTFGTDVDIGLVVLADGMGGYKAGEVASGITVRTVMGLIKDAVERENLGHSDDATGLSRSGILLRDSIQRDVRGRTVFLRQAHDRARRRFPALPLPRGQARTGHAGSLPAAGARLARVLHARGSPKGGCEELCDACTGRGSGR